MIAGRSHARRAQVSPKCPALSRRLSIHFSLSCTLIAALTSRHFDVFNRESGFHRQTLFPQMPAPDVTPEKHLKRGSKRHSKERTDDSANDQAPDKNRHDYRHWM